MSRESLFPGGAARIRPCSTCGDRPTGTVRVGADGSLGWLECKVCRKRTAEGQSYEEACREWNGMQSGLSGRLG